MRKIFVIVLLLTFLFTALFATMGVAEAETSPTIYDIAVDFAAMHPKRDILSGGEAAAAATLVQALNDDGYTVTTPTFREYEESSSGKKVVYDYKHVVGYMDHGKGKCILIGCYYGGFEGEDSHGAGNGASAALSVATVVYLASYLADRMKDYDLAIAFWGGIELGSVLDVTKCGIDLDKIALYINLDCIAAGERDYLYVDDVPRATEDFFRDVASDVGADLAEPPVYLRSSSLSYGDGDPYTYTHLGLLSANRFFMGAGIPCVNFVGGAWDYDSGLFRYERKGDIEGTSLDTITSIDEMNGGADVTASRLLAVANVVISALESDRLPSVLEEAAGEVSSASLDNSLAYYLISFIGTALLIAALIFLFVKQGKDRRETIWEAPRGGSDDNPFTEFVEREDPPASDDDGDDIYRL